MSFEKENHSDERLSMRRPSIDFKDVHAAYPGAAVVAFAYGRHA